MLSIISTLVSLGFLRWLFKSASFKGYIGEVFVNLLIGFMLDKEKYILIKNVTMPTEDGTTQIDHIIVSQYGLFVIETKNLKGWIFGYKDDDQWTQKLFKVTHHFQNPLRQNYKHVKTLESTLGIDIRSIFSVIVFVGDSTFKTEVPDNVTRPFGLISYIKSKETILFSDDEVTDMIVKIHEGKLAPTLKTHLNHVEHVKEIIKEKKSKRRTGKKRKPEKVCPECGSGMFMTESKYGENNGLPYWGCPRECQQVE